MKAKLIVCFLAGKIRISVQLPWILFPSADENEYNKCVTLIQVDGLYSCGINPKEAKLMVDHIVQFMIDNPTLSLGVVTVNQKQMNLIKEEMEYVYKKNQTVEKYKEYWKTHRDGLEAFFIKNIETVQGDERDVIFIGTVYGPESHGSKVMQRFGPIAGVSGKRRLNVLFSRAKRHIRTFSSMTAADIQTEEENSNPGAYMLKCWLEYAASGKLDRGMLTNNDTDSDFEEFVIKCIESLGCKAIPQVGVAGYFVDIGVKHPDWPYGFIMGVECDGASYHSTKSARDRDRLRQEILERRNWYLYRIWSTDWFNDPRKETEKLRKAIQDRIYFLKNNV